nr:hypothetical protein [Tanacetum cinerariifolium]
SNNDILVVKAMRARMRPFNVNKVSKIKDAFRNKQYKPKDIKELIQRLFNDVQNIHEELAEYIVTPSWNRHAFYNYDDDVDEDYTIAITHVLSTEEPDFSDSNDDSTSIDDDYFSIDDIAYVEASPSDSELVSLEEVKDDILREKLWNIHLLIAKIESLNDNPNPDRIERDQGELTSVVMEDILGEPRVHVPKVFPTYPTLYLDSNFTPFDNSLPESEIFCFDIEEKNSATIHADIILLDLECFYFKSEPDPRDLTSIIEPEIRENVSPTTNVNLPFEDD